VISAHLATNRRSDDATKGSNVTPPKSMTQIDFPGLASPTQQACLFAFRAGSGPGGIRPSSPFASLVKHAESAA
jgi:hypothetical protein